MSLVIQILGVCLSYVVASPLKTHYLYADNPGTGFVRLNSYPGHNNYGRHNHPIGLAEKQRRILGSPNPQTYQRTTNERMMISKSPNIESTAKEVNRSPAVQVTEPPKRQQIKDDKNFMQDPRNHRAMKGKSSPNQNFRNTNPRHNEFKHQTKQYDQTYNKNKGNIYDIKSNKQVNVHKTLIPAEPQKVKLNSNRQLTALSVQRREDNYKRMPTSMLVDKTLQKAATFKERNALIMSRVLDDMTKKVTDRRIKNNEYKKRDTVSTYAFNPHAKRNIVSDNIKKYIGKEVNIMNISPQTEARVITHEEENEDKNAPYALFYRMSPETLGNQEGFYLFKSMEDDGDKVFSTKKKRLSVNFDNELDLKKTKTKKNFNSVKLRRKMKNFDIYNNNI